MRGVASLLIVMCAQGMVNGQGPLRVDLNPDIARSDILAPGWQSWKIKDGSNAAASIAGVSFVLKGSGLKADWHKQSAVPEARMASDGVIARGQLVLTIGGLSAGRHTLATFHSSFDGKSRKPCRLAVAGAGSTATPSIRAPSDADVPACFVEFSVEPGKEVVATLTPIDGEEVVFNGLEVDFSDPSRRASKPIPGNGDEHAVAGPTLSWRAGQAARSHQIYIGANRDAVVRAEPNSPEFRGQSAEPRFSTASLGLNTHDDCYWRIDEVSDAGTTRGEAWRFRVRQLAFPGAEGYGRFARGGRAGKVYQVTCLDDSGPGSLREAVEASGPRTVVFRVGGIIALRSKLVVRNPYLTIAGQTAPADGICLKGFTVGCLDAHDVIIRHVRIRVGDEAGITQDGSGARACDHVIYDHCSISWSIDEGFSSREARNLTVQRCIISEALHLANHKKYQGTGKGHSFAGSISGDIGSFHHNLLANCTGRNWSLAGGLDRSGQKLAGRLDIRNNIVYNWRDRTTDGGVRELNFVNNVYLPGPATKVHTLLKPDPGDPERGMRAFMEGNVLEGKPELTADNWKAFVGPANGLAMVRSPKPLFEPFVHTEAANEALASVLADVGATLPRQDAVDKRILAETRQRAHTYTGSRGKLPGIIDTQADAGGWPGYQSGEAPLDTDGDGMPDEWEKAHGLDAKNPADGARYRPDGYTSLELYLNELAAKRW